MFEKEKKKKNKEKKDKKKNKKQKTKNKKDRTSKGFTASWEPLQLLPLLPSLPLPSPCEQRPSSSWHPPDGGDAPCEPDARDGPSASSC